MKITLTSILDEDRDPDNESQASGFQDTSEAETTFEKLYHGLFGVLYLMAKDTSVSFSAAYMYSFVNTLQLLYYSFSVEGNFPWHHQVYATITPVLRYINFGFVEDLNSHTLFMIVMATFLLLGGVFFIGIYVGYSFGLDGTVKQIWLLPILRTLARLLTTVFYLPVLTVLLTCLDCASPLGEYPNLSCNDSARTVLVVAASLLLLLFVLLNGITALVFIGRRPDEQDALAQPHGRIDFCANLIKTVISIVFVLLRTRNESATMQELDEYSLMNTNFTTMVTFQGFLPFREDGHDDILIATLIIGYTFVLAIYLYYLPFYKVRTNKLFIASYTLCWWSSVCLVFTAIVGDRLEASLDHGPILLFLVSAPVVSYSATTLVQARISALRKKTAAHSPFVQELCLRYKYPEGTDMKSVWDDVKDEYRDAVDKNRRNGFICLHVALLFDVWGNNKLMSSQYTRRAAQIPDLPLDQKFLIFQHKVLVDQDQKGTNGALSYMAFDHHYKRAQSYMSDTLLKVTEFWFRLRKNNYTMEILFNIGDRVQKSSESAKYHLDQLLQVSGGSPRALRLYAVYCEDIMNDKALAKRIVVKANDLEGMENDFMEAFEDDAMDESFGAGGNHFAAEVIDQSNFALASSACIATLSGDDHSIGEIISVTDGVVHMFGYQRSQLIGQNISMLCPPPFDIVHDLFLKRYIETEKNMVTKKRKVWGFHKDGYSLSIDLYVMPIVNSNGSLGFTGKFIQAKNEFDFFLVSDSGRIFTASKKLFLKCKLSRNEIEEGTATVQSYIPELDVEDLVHNPEFLYGLQLRVLDKECKVQAIPINLSSDDARASYSISIIMLRVQEIQEEEKVVEEIQQPVPVKSQEARGSSRVLPIIDSNSEGDSRSVNSARSEEEAQVIVAPNQLPGEVPLSKASEGSVVKPLKDRRQRNPEKSLTHEGSTASLSRRSRRKTDNKRSISVGLKGTASSAKVGLAHSGSQASMMSDSPSEISSWTIQSRGAGGKRLHRIHHQITEKIRYQDTRLATFRKFCIVMVMIFASAAFFEYYTYSLTGNKYIESMELTYYTLRRSFLVNHISYEVHLLASLKNATYDASLFNDQSLEATVGGLADELEESIAEFRSLHDLITNSHAATSELVRPTMETVDVETVNKDGTTEFLSLNVAMLTFGNYARDLVANVRENGELSECNEGCNFIESNGPFALRTASFNVVAAYQGYATQFLSSQVTTDRWTLGIVIVLVLVILFYGLFPIVNEIQKSRNVAAKAFASIPSTTTSVLFKNCKSKLYHLQTGEEHPVLVGQNQDDNNNEKDGGKEEDLAMKAKINQIESVESKRNFRDLSVSSKLAKVRDSLPLLQFIMKLVLPFGFAIAYFSSSTMIRVGLFPNPDDYSTSLYYSGIRWVTVESTYQFLQTEFWEAENTYTMWERNISLIQTTLGDLNNLITDVDKALLFGNDEYGIPAMIDHSSPYQQAVNFEHGCEFPVSHLATSTCDNIGETEFDKLLNVGLYGALQLYETTLADYLELMMQWSALPSGSEQEQVVAEMQGIRSRILDDEFLRHDFGASLEHATDLFLVELLDKMKAQLASLAWILLVMNLCLILLYYYVYRVFLGKNLQIKNTLVLLLMVPAEVFKQVPAMQRMVESPH